jgi:mannose-6-phosphate isomerase-like protein (cupin superfamily)
MLYVVKGEAVLEMDGQRQLVKPGWFSIIPRGTPYTLERKGRPAILLSVVGGQPCPPSATRAAR